MVSRSDHYTITSKQITYYSDFTTDFDRNPLTGNLARLTNEDAIKQSLQSLILTQNGERFFQPWIGSKIQGLLFELFDSTLIPTIKDQINLTIQQCEPRVEVDNINVDPDTFDQNTINITIYFTIRNVASDNFSLTFSVSRVR